MRDMTEALGPETSKLLADVASLRRLPGETPEARLARLAADPVAVFKALNLPPRDGPPPAAYHPTVRARMVAAMAVRKAEMGNTASRRPATVLHPLRATAPVIAAPRIYNDEVPAPFEPTAADRAQAIDAMPLERFFPVLALCAAVTTALVLWLML